MSSLPRQPRVLESVSKMLATKPPNTTQQENLRARGCLLKSSSEQQKKTELPAAVVGTGWVCPVQGLVQVWERDL